MRKSSAPSRKHVADESVSSKSHKLVQTAELSGSSGKLHRFDVAYAKASTRKHKTYSDDGILEIQDLKATLKDEHGRVSSASFKSADYQRFWFLFMTASRLNASQVSRRHGISISVWRLWASSFSRNHRRTGIQTVQGRVSFRSSGTVKVFGHLRRSDEKEAQKFHKRGNAGAKWSSASLEGFPRWCKEHKSFGTIKR